MHPTIEGDTLPVHLLGLPGRGDRNFTLVTESVQPGPHSRASGLELLNFAGLLQGQPNVVQTVQQAMAAEGVDGEGNGWLATWATDFILLEIDFEIGGSLRLAGEVAYDVLGEDDGQHAVLHSVGVEDIGKAGSNDASNTEVVPIEHILDL